MICGRVEILLSDDSNKTVNQFNEPAGWNELSKQSHSLKRFWLAVNWCHFVWHKNSNLESKHDLNISHGVCVHCIVLFLLHYEMKCVLKIKISCRDRGKKGRQDVMASVLIEYKKNMSIKTCIKSFNISCYNICRKSG